MFETLTNRLTQVFHTLRRRGKLSFSDVEAAMREVRMALLEADVHYVVVKDFITRVQARAVGHEVSRALNPGQQVIKIVNEELVSILGVPTPLILKGVKPHLILLVGLQGSGKTTTAGKLANLLLSRGERCMLVAGDPYRPAAVQQLQSLGARLDVPVAFETGLKPPDMVQRAAEKARRGEFNVLIMDTAGRSQLDDELMDELRNIVACFPPTEVLLVIDAMTGQEALNIAEGFKKAIPVTGVILTKMDGDARGGAAISIRTVTGVPIKFLGTGEKLDALEVYNPDRLVSRILGLGDMLGLIEKAEAAFSESETNSQVGGLGTDQFTLEDFAQQLRTLRKMGPLSQVLEMMPGGMGRMAQRVSPQDAERQMKVTEAIIGSMTVAERRNPDILNASRRRRIACGSGTEVQDVNRLIKQFREFKGILTTLQKTGGRGLPRLFG